MFVLSRVVVGLARQKKELKTDGVFLYLEIHTGLESTCRQLKKGEILGVADGLIAGKPAPTVIESYTDFVYTKSPVGAGLPAMTD